MTTTNWTTKSGKQVEMISEVVGKTATDLICSDIKLTIDGQKMNVIGRATEKGVACLRLLVNHKYMLIALPEGVGEMLDEEVAKVKAIAAATIKDEPEREAKELRDYLFAREMSNPNSEL